MIVIKYGNGEIQIDPYRYLNSRNATAGKFRKLVKLSLKSDLIYGTNAIAEWAEAIDSPFNLLIAKTSSERLKSKLKKLKEILEECAIDCTK